MAYRFNNIPPKPEDMLRRFDVRNGAIMRATFGCYYAHVAHDYRLHDHHGWPTPTHPDDICQLLPTAMHPWWVCKRDRPMSFEPIDLIEEGYNNAYVTFEDEENAQYLETNALIDPDSANTVRMTVKANMPNFSDKPIDMRFTLFISNSDQSAIDAVCHGIITVLPGNPGNLGD